MLSILFDNGIIVMIGIIAFVLSLFYSFYISESKTKIDILDNQLTIHIKNWFLKTNQIKIKFPKVKSYEVGRYNGKYINIITKDLMKIKLYEIDRTFDEFILEFENKIKIENNKKLQLQSIQNEENKPLILIEKTPSIFETRSGKIFFGFIGFIGLIGGLKIILFDKEIGNSLILIGIGISLLSAVFIKKK
jgi:hypothetical protein